MQPRQRSSADACLYGLIALLILIPLLAALGVPLFVLGDNLGLWSHLNPQATLDPRAFARVTMTFGKPGTGPGLLSEYSLICVDPASGTIYVGDFDGRRVQRFDANGKFLSQWPVGDSGAIGGLYALAANRSGVVYVIDSAGSGGKINRYEGATGKNLGPVVYLGQQDDFKSLAVGADGWLVALTSDAMVVYFNSDGQVELTFRPPVSAAAELTVAIDGLGQIYVLSDNAVSRFSPEGEYMLSFGSKGDYPGELNFANAIAVDGQRRLYVSDSKGIQVFDSTGRDLDVINIQGAVSANGLAFDDQNNLYAVTNKSQVTKFAILK